MYLSFKSGRGLYTIASIAQPAKLWAMQSGDAHPFPLKMHVAKGDQAAIGIALTGQLLGTTTTFFFAFCLPLTDLSKSLQTVILLHLPHGRKDMIELLSS